MARGKTHLFFGFMIGALFVAFTATAYPGLTKEALLFRALLGFVFCSVGALLPDVDESHSAAFRSLRAALGATTFFAALYLLSQAGFSMRTVVLAAVLAAAAIAALYVLKPRHRGITHTLRAGAVYAAAVFALCYFLIPDAALSLTVALFGFGGYASHLALDKKVKP